MQKKTDIPRPDPILFTGFTAAASSVGAAPDIWNVTLASPSSSVATITINYRTTAGDGYTATGTWNLPQ